MNIRSEDYFHFARNSVHCGRIYSEHGDSTFLRKLSGFVLDDVTPQNAVVFIDSSLSRPTSQCLKCSFTTGFPGACLCVLQCY